MNRMLLTLTLGAPDLSTLPSPTNQTYYTLLKSAALAEDATYVLVRRISRAFAKRMNSIRVLPCLSISEQNPNLPAWDLTLTNAVTPAHQTICIPPSFLSFHMGSAKHFFCRSLGTAVWPSQDHPFLCVAACLSILEGHVESVKRACVCL